MILINFRFGYTEHDVNGNKITHPNALIIEDREHGISLPFDFDEISKKYRNGTRYTASVPLYLLNHLLYFLCVEGSNVVDLGDYSSDRVDLGEISSDEGFERACGALNKAFDSFPDLRMKISRDKNCYSFDDPAWVQANVRWETNINDIQLNEQWFSARYQIFGDLDIYQYEEPSVIQTISWEVETIRKEIDLESTQIDQDLLPAVKADDDDTKYPSLFDLFVAHESIGETADKRLIIFDGPAGSGKSYSLRDARDKINAGAEGGKPLAFYTELKDLIIRDMELIPWLLHFTSVKESKNPGRAFERLSFSMSRLFFIIDGFDEIGPEHISRYIDDIQWLITNPKLDNVQIVLGTRNADVFLRSAADVGINFADTGYRHIRTCYYETDRFNDPITTDFIGRFPEGGTPFFVQIFNEFRESGYDTAYDRVKSEYDLLRIQTDQLIRKAKLVSTGSQTPLEFIYTLILPQLAYLAYVNDDPDTPGAIDESLLSDSEKLRYILKKSPVYDHSKDSAFYVEYFLSLEAEERVNTLINTGEVRSKYGVIVFNHITTLQYYAAVQAAKIVSGTECSAYCHEDDLEKIKLICDSISYYPTGELSQEALRNMFFVYCLFRELIQLRGEATQFRRKAWEHRLDLLKTGMDLGAWDMYEVFDQLSDHDQQLLDHLAVSCDRYRLHVSSGKSASITQCPDFMTLQLANASLYNSIGRAKRNNDLDALQMIEGFYVSIAGCVLAELYSAFDSRSFNRKAELRARKKTFFDRYGELSAGIAIRAGLLTGMQIHIESDEPEVSSNGFSWRNRLCQRDLLYLLGGLPGIIKDKSNHMIWQRKLSSSKVCLDPDFAAKLIESLGTAHMARAVMVSEEEFEEISRAEKIYDYVHRYRVDMMYISGSFNPVIISGYYNLAISSCKTGDLFASSPTDREYYYSYSFYETAIKYCANMLMLLGWSLDRIHEWKADEPFQQILAQFDISRLDADGLKSIAKPYITGRKIIPDTAPVGGEPYKFTLLLARCYYRLLDYVDEKEKNAFLERYKDRLIAEEYEKYDKYDLTVLILRLVNATSRFLIETCADNMRLNRCRSDIENLFMDVKDNYMHLLGSLTGDDRSEALTILNEVLCLYQQININYRGMKVEDNGHEFLISPAIKI